MNQQLIALNTVNRLQQQEPAPETEFLTVATPWVSWLMIGTFVFLALVFIIVSIILDYHWRKYELGIERVKTLRTIYFSISGAFLVMLLIFMILYFV